jgi:hypothetical protein
LKEMSATAVPMIERDKAIGFIPSIINELYSEQRNWSERDAGFNPNLDEIKELSQPEQELEFKVEKRAINKRNIDKPKRGDGSPGKVTAKPPLPDDSHDADE